MQYVTRPIRVDAVQFPSGTTVTMDGGEEVEVNPGDWIVKESDGSQSIVQDTEFKEKYEPYVPGGARVPIKITAAEAFELFEEKEQPQPVMRVVPGLPYPPENIQTQSAPIRPQNLQRYPFDNLPQVIPSQLPANKEVPKKKSVKKKPSGLGGLFGGAAKKKKQRDEISDGNIQTV